MSTGAVSVSIAPVRVNTGTVRANANNAGASIIISCVDADIPIGNADAVSKSPDISCVTTHIASVPIKTPRVNIKPVFLNWLNNAIVNLSALPAIAIGQSRKNNNK